MAQTFRVEFSDRPATTIVADAAISNNFDVLFYNRGVTPATWTVVAAYVAGIVTAIRALP